MGEQYELVKGLPANDRPRKGKYASDSELDWGQLSDGHGTKTGGIAAESWYADLGRLSVGTTGQLEC